MATAQTHVMGWPALLTQEAACFYLSIDAEHFAELTVRWRLAPVALDAKTWRWRRSELDRIIKRLPTGAVSQHGSAGSVSLRLDQDVIDRLAAAVAQRLAATVPDVRPEPWHLLSVREAAAALRVGRSMIYRLIGDGRLQVRKVGNRTLITRESLAAVAEAPTSARGG